MSSGTPKHQRAEPGNAGSPGPTRNQAQQTWTPGNSKGLEWEYHCVYLGTSPGQRTLHLALLGGPGQAMAKREKWKCLSLSAWQGPQHRGWYCASLRYAARVWSSTLPEPPGSALFTTTGPFPNRGRPGCESLLKLLEPPVTIASSSPAHGGSPLGPVDLLPPGSNVENQPPPP